MTISIPVIAFPILRYGSSGAWVGKLHEILGVLGYYSQPIYTGIFKDPSFTRTTEEAVKSFQRYNVLVIDGIVNDKTWTLLVTKYEAAQNISPIPNWPIENSQKQLWVSLLVVGLGLAFLGNSK